MRTYSIISYHFVLCHIRACLSNANMFANTSTLVDGVKSARARAGGGKVPPSPPLRAAVYTNMLNMFYRCFTCSGDESVDLYVKLNKNNINN